MLSIEGHQRLTARLRAAGLRPVQTRVPDTSAPGVEAECRRQMRNINAATAVERDALDFIAAVMDRDGDSAGSA